MGVANDWYADYGWCADNWLLGQVPLQVVEPHWLDDTESAIERTAETLYEDWPCDADASPRRRQRECRAVAEELVRMARVVWDAAREVEDALRSAVAAYRRGDLEGVLKALEWAHEVESDHGGAPATDALMQDLLEELEEA